MHAAVWTVTVRTSAHAHLTYAYAFLLLPLRRLDSIATNFAILASLGRQRHLSVSYLCEYGSTPVS